MTIIASPANPNSSHHFTLQDRDGNKVGLTICNDKGVPLPFYDAHYSKNPIFTTAFKQTSGSGGYDIFDYPYAPVVQDDLSGGRGNLDFERDSTRFYDSYRTNSGRANKAYAGALEHYAEGTHRLAIQSLPGSVGWVKLTEEARYVYKQFQASALTVGKLWLNLRKHGTPGDLTVELWSTSGANLGTELGSLTITSDDPADILSEWINETLSLSLTAGTYYWLVIYGDETDSDNKHWKLAVEEGSGCYSNSNFASNIAAVDGAAAGFDLYYRLTSADAERTITPFTYKEGQYFVISTVTGAPKIYQAGDRGACDSNSGQLTKVIDATKSWTTNEWAGAIVLITQPRGEVKMWRRIVSNTTTQLTCDEAWNFVHTTTTDYVIISPKIKEITGHGLSAPVTDVLVSSQDVIYFCMGEFVTVRRLRAFNDAGTWKDFGHADCKADESAGTKARFMVYKSIEDRIVLGTNYTSDGLVGTQKNSNTSPNIPTWGTALTWNAVEAVGSKYAGITAMLVHPDGSNNEAVWVFKEDMPYVLPTSGDPYEAAPHEFKTVRSLLNGVNPLVHDVYLYFPLLQGVQRYYGGTYTSVGPNLDEGLPEGRRGPVVDMLGFAGKFFVAVDGGDDGYSSILTSGGYHEFYRGPKGQRITRMAFETVPGEGGRLWVYQGNDLVYFNFPTETTNELEDGEYEYAPEFAVELARMHAGMYDVQKMIKVLKIQSDELAVDENGNPLCWFELDFKRDGDTEWTVLGDPFTESPTQEIDFTTSYGLAGKRLRFRLRGYTRDKNLTPVFLAIIIYAVLRVDVKNMYGPFTVLCADGEMLTLRDEDRTMGAAGKLDLLERWSDASHDSLLLLNSVASLCDGKMVFLNMGTRRQVQFRSESGNEHRGDAYVVSLSFQDA